MSGLRNAVAVVVLSLATVLVVTAVSSAVDIHPTCDTYVDSRTGAGYPNAGTLHLGDTSPSNGQVDRARAYFKFDLTEAIPWGAYPTYAELHVRCQGLFQPPMDVGAYYLENDDWDCDINWAHAPAPSSSPTDVVVVSTSNWYDWTVTSDVVDAWSDDQGYSVVLRHTNENAPPRNSDWDSMEDYYEMYPYLSVGFQYGRDFGDAPDPTYPTLFTSNGAWHSLETGPHLGDYIDYEPDGQPDLDALGDDAGWPGVDDEDGVIFTSPLIPGETATVTVTSSGHGYLSAWIDFDISGGWNQLGEAIFVSEEVWTGTNLLSFTVPAGATPGRTFARFRVTAVNFPILSYDGGCDSGEVEDHMVYLGETDWGDAPDPTYPTTSASNGAWHLIANGLFLGTTVDHELDGQPHPGAIGDDINVDDEDGVVFTSWLMPGRNATVEVVSSAGGYLDAWVDFNGDGSWAEPGDQIFTAEPLVVGINVLTFTVPAGASSNIATFSRFRVSSQGGLPFDGLAEDGEVEDHYVEITPVTEKWLQSPDLGDTCLDANTSYPYALADNFVCTERGALIEIDVWGAWYQGNDGFDFDTFTLVIHEDGTPPGTPGTALWTRSFAPGEYAAELTGSGLAGGWLEPGGMYITHDWTCWRLRFHVDPLEAFEQEGSEQIPLTYWLAVQSDAAGGDDFGWRNSVDPAPWDGSVYGFGVMPIGGGWQSLLYPVGHQYADQPMNLAFSITSANPTGVDEDEVTRAFRLHQNTPNPFNPVTSIRYDVPAEGGRVLLEVFDVNGRLVRTLVDKHNTEGTHHVSWRGDDESGQRVPSGIYFYKLSTDGFTQMLKMLVLK